MIIRYPFSSVLKKDIITLEQKKILKKKYRDKFGFNFYNKIAIMVGRFIPLKRFDLVINFWEKVSANDLLLVIGEGNELIKYSKIIKAKKLLGYEPKVTFKEGIQKFKEWFINSKV
jgi:glycosyltransferase involved in cell wall biosynthesis